MLTNRPPAPPAPPAPPSRNGTPPAPPRRTADTTRRSDPHLGLRFWIQLGQIEIAGFRECSSVTVETETEEYIEGGLNTYTHKLPVRAKYSNITLKRGLDEGQDLYTWYLRAMRGDIKRQDISIIVYNSLGREVRRWDLRNAYPCKWIGPDLNTEHGALAIESVEIAHEGLLTQSERQQRQIQANRR